MNREKALALVKEQITERRYIHTLGVVESAIELAERYGADVKKSGTCSHFP
jgi:HD superfamily phosphohydrolase YqeK